MATADSLPEAVLGSVFGLLADSKDVFNALLVCKHWLAAAVAQAPLWRALRVSDNKGDRQGLFWAAHSRHVRQLRVALSAARGGPGVFLRLLSELAGAEGLPELQSLDLALPGARNPGMVAWWMGDAFQTINSLSSLRHLRLAYDSRSEDSLPYWDWFCYEQRLPLLLQPGRLPCLESLVVEFLPWGEQEVDVPAGALAGLGALTKLHLGAGLVRTGQSGQRTAAPGAASAPAGAQEPSPPCTLTLEDLRGTTGLRHLRWAVSGSGRLALGEEEALGLLGRLEVLEVEDPERLSAGVWAAVAQLQRLTRVVLMHDDERLDEHTADPGPMLALASCPNLVELTTNWLPPLGGLFPGQLAALTRLTLANNEAGALLDPSWAALPALRVCALWGQPLPPWLGQVATLETLSIRIWGKDEGMLDALAELPALTALHLRQTAGTWALPCLPFLSTLRELTIQCTAAEQPVPLALAAATSLTTLRLFPYASREVLLPARMRLRLRHAPTYIVWEPRPPPAEAWADAEQHAVLRTLAAASLRRVEVVEDLPLWDFKLGEVAGAGACKKAVQAPEWALSAQALAGELEGAAGACVEVVARRSTLEEAQALHFRT